ncbi:MAG TPA: hypothetical protein VGZ71_07900 [Puia sp.]|nr:hypothetical protein [Puia sp.]
MKVLLVILSLFAFIIPNAFASSSNNYSDTTIQKKQYKHNKMEFLQYYGKDDSSRALILYYFAKREKSMKFIYVPWGIGIGVGVIIGVVSLFKEISLSIPLALFLYLLVEAIVILSLTGVIQLIMFSRKLILRRLNNYFTGKSIPKRIKRSHLFIQFLSGKMSRSRRNPQFLFGKTKHI